MLQGDIDNAVKDYEKDLLNNPNDTHSLLVLSKIYSIGTRIKHDDNRKEINEGRNPERAFELAKKLYNITGDMDYQRNALRGLASSSNRDVDWILAKYNLIDAKTLDYSDYGIMGNLYLIKGNLFAADECYDKVFSIIKDKKLYDLRPVLLNLYNKDYNNAIRYLNKTDLSYYRFDVKAFEDHIKKVKDSPKDTIEYKKFETALKTVLGMESTLDIKDEFKSEFEDVRNPAYWSILRQVGEYYYLFQQ